MSEHLGHAALTREVHRISVVVPVYGGERTLAGVVAEIAELAQPSASPDGHAFEVVEVLLVFDNGHDRSPEVIRELDERYTFVRPVWLSRNYGQHAATLAGMASSGGDWIVTLDEDGQHDPADIGAFLDVAMREQVGLVYALATNPPPHGFLRNLASKGAKWLLSGVLAGGAATSFQSYRLVLGELGRTVAAYAGAGVYLDVAMGWVCGPVATCPVALREEGDRQSGYNYRSLLSHFWRLVLTSGTRGLRVVSLLGVLFAVAGIVYTLFLVVATLVGGSPNAPSGWTSTMVVVLLSTGAMLFSLGVIAEYIGVAVNMAMGKPPYLIVGDPVEGPLGRRLPPR